MITETGIWTQDTADATHQSSPALAKFLTEYLDRKKVTFDFGCGNGYYLGRLEAAGFFPCIGVEGFHLDNFQCKDVFVRDLTQPINFQKQGNVISLEVGEHLPKWAQETFMQTVTRHCDGKLVFSWAEIGQPGLGHINCRDQQEVIADVESRGFNFQKDLSLQVRQTIEENCSWFQRTLLIFERA